ncbi:hypothetical protein NIASO_07920 [Niabella soli DSM 19437]|uniref:Uncharacterized protein n=1 Tax=Niabella soli DSM 19437 TaxID=929713 RepID=W0F331_9BACT|nr:hypothetical protein NIASO_07920 [Niabella soli DSM 19437]
MTVLLKAATKQNRINRLLPGKKIKLKPFEFIKIQLNSKRFLILLKMSNLKNNDLCLVFEKT